PRAPGKERERGPDRRQPLRSKPIDTVAVDLLEQVWRDDVVAKLRRGEGCSVHRLEPVRVRRPVTDDGGVVEESAELEAEPLQRLGEEVLGLREVGLRRRAERAPAT